MGSRRHKSALAKAADKQRELEQLITLYKTDNANMLMLFAFAALANSGEFRIKPQEIEFSKYELKRDIDKNTNEIVFTVKEKENATKQ